MEPAAPHILIIDDDPEIRLLLTGFPRKNGFRVTGGGDGRAMRRAVENLATNAATHGGAARLSIGRGAA
jgi:DNA-binding response OmpR family regulator